MAAPVNSSGLLQADNIAAGTITLNAGFTFTAGRDAVFQGVFWAVGDNVTGVTIGGTAATLRVNSEDAGNNILIIAEAKGIAGGTANVVIQRDGTQGAFTTGAVTEWASADGLTYDTGTANTATGTGTAPAVSTAATTSQASTIVFGVVLDSAGSASNVFTGPTGWTVLFTENDGVNHEGGSAAWVEETSAGTKTATWSETQGGGWSAGIAAYKLTIPATGSIMGQASM